MVLQTGSSPRVRGTLLTTVIVALAAGIIPACAGNTRQTRPHRSPPRDHPRVCGEHRVHEGRTRQRQGSSPRVRGTPRSSRSPEGHHGIIPACAGNTRRRLRMSPQGGDHPRVCGEHPFYFSGSRNRSGSSPRVRGTRPCGRLRTAPDGIIPACAGNTPARSPPSCPPRDHPRVCGEHLYSLVDIAADLGSSPRVRGTPGQGPSLVQDPGIIPACAGNTSALLRPLAAKRDHPRVCGEHVLPRPRAPIIKGSSPRVRGTLFRTIIDIEIRGIIPACAGNTRRVSPARTCIWDHPRVCGEHRITASWHSNPTWDHPRVCGEHALSMT